MKQVTQLLSLLSSVILSASATSVIADSGQPFKLDNWQTENISALNTKYHDAFATISPDGKTMYFSSNRDSNDDTSANWLLADYDIYVSTRTDLAESTWSTPKTIGSTINASNFSDHSITLSFDGHYMFFASTRPGGCDADVNTPDNANDLDLYVSYRSDVNNPFGWGSPQHLGCSENGGVNDGFIDSCPVYTIEDGVEKIVWIKGLEAGLPGLDVYESVITRNSDTSLKLSAPVKNEEVSTAGAELHFDPNHGYIWAVKVGEDDPVYGNNFGGNGVGSPDVDADGNGLSDAGSDVLFVVKHGPKGKWSSAINPGAAVNTVYEDQMPTSFADGKRLYYPSDRPGGQGGLDLYLSKFVGNEK